MIYMSDLLLSYMTAFQERFDDVIPLSQLPSWVTNDDLIDAIIVALEENRNTLPEKFGYTPTK